MDVKPVIADEVQLVDWGESRSGGPWVKLRLSDPALLERLRGLDTATAKHTGHIFDLLLAESAQDPKPEVRRKWDDLSAVEQAGICCNEPQFWKYMGADNRDECIAELRATLEIKSRSELSEPEKARQWEKLYSGYWAYKHGYEL
jgi:hypothetical protein